MRELQPVNQNVILDVSEEVSEQKTAGGIIIPDTAAVEKPKFAKVVALITGHVSKPVDGLAGRDREFGIDG